MWAHFPEQRLVIEPKNHLFTLLKLWCMLKLQSRFKELEEQMEMKKVTNLSFSLSYAISPQHTQFYQI